MPDPASAGAGAPRELVLAASAADLPGGIPCIAFGDAAAAEGALRPGDLIRPQRERLREAFILWLGGINVANASIAWWTHNTSSKNLLASRLGNAVFDLLALRQLLGGATDSAPARVGVVGASAAQVEAIRRMAVASGGALRVTRLGAEPPAGGGSALRLVALAMRALLEWALWMRPARASGQAAVRLFTYADAGFRDGADAFFGQLAGHLAAHEPPLSCMHHPWVHGAPAEVVPKLRVSARFRYSPLLSELGAGDILGALRDALLAAARVGRWPAPALLEGLDLEPLLRESLREDLAGGNYFAVLLIHRAARRLAARARPPLVIYPYENKSLEKLLLLGLREGNPLVRIVGYQHTSVTPRHTTLVFAPGEAACTPLPDRVVTLGEVTRAWLESHGRYPAGLLVEGFALRQAARGALARRKPAPGEGARVLFVLSSSIAELAAAAHWLLEAARLRPTWQFALRPHPEFPIARLPESLRAAVAARAQDLSGTPLEENLRWADTVAYASSTVALEALMAGRPVVNIDLGEPLEVDPVLEPVTLHWRAADAAELVAAVEAGAALDDAAFECRRDGARRFIDRYLRPFTPAGLARLLDEAPSR